MEQSYEEKLYFSTADLSGHTWKSDNWLERKSVIDELGMKQILTIYPAFVAQIEYCFQMMD